MIRSKCLICGSEKLDEIIDLGTHPFADTFIPESRIQGPDMIYPLICDLCSKCGQIQTRFSTDPISRYAQFDYSYTSSNSNFSRDHWDEFAEDMEKDNGMEKNSFIVEIGSNDGYLSEKFLVKGYKILGVDPSPYMAEIAKKRNIETKIALFNKNLSQEIIKTYGKANLIIANNVFNHSENPLDFAKAVSELLTSNGKFVFELPYWKIGVESSKFDQIYHEHVSYFTVKSSKELLERVGMKIKSIKIVNYHGGSLRVIAQKEEYLKDNCPDTEKIIEEETKYGLFDLNTYKKFMEKNIEKRDKFLKKIYEIRVNKIPIIAVGAAAKGNTFLNFYNLDNSIIDYVTDSSLHKQGKYTPATRIPIVGDEIFGKYDKVYALILSWNIANQLKEILYPINPNIDFIAPE